MEVEAANSLDLIADYGNVWRAHLALYVLPRRLPASSQHFRKVRRVVRGSVTNLPGNRLSRRKVPNNRHA